MYFPFLELRKWGKKAAENRRRNCAVLPLISFRVERDLLLEYASAPPYFHTAQKCNAAAGRPAALHTTGYSIGFIIFKRMASLESKPSFR